MKKIKFITIAITLCLMALATGTVSAQEKSLFPADKVAQKETDKMTDDLGLNASQKKAVLALNKEMYEKRRQAYKAFKNAHKKEEKGPSKQAGEAFKNAGNKARADYEKSLKDILTAEQFKEYKKQDAPIPARKNK